MFTRNAGLQMSKYNHIFASNWRLSTNCRHISKTWASFTQSKANQTFLKLVTLPVHRSTISFNYLWVASQCGCKHGNCSLPLPILSPPSWTGGFSSMPVLSDPAPFQSPLQGWVGGGGCLDVEGMREPGAVKKDLKKLRGGGGGKKKRQKNSDTTGKAYNCGWVERDLSSNIFRSRVLNEWSRAGLCQCHKVG